VSTPPSVIQRYRIIKQIGQGGMGALYLAADPALDRLTAIKLLKEDNEELRQRFAREARSAARLSHINIVTIYDVGEHDGQPFIAMEYVEGKTLADIIRQRPAIALRQKLDWMCELCDGLHHAHSSQIIHRDIKPANIMISTAGRVKILDFGIARFGESSITQVGVLVGTINYMAPEQLMGQDVDTRTDIFAVGAVCYELLTYKQAFPGAIESGLLHRILSSQPDAIEQTCPGIDPELVRIVGRAMAKSSAARYSDLSTLRRDLDRVRQRTASASAAEGTVINSPMAETVALDTPAPKSDRRKTDREGLARRRATELAGHLSDAHAALDERRLDDAVAACERALILDEENREALDLLDKAQAAIEQRQVERWLDEAREAVDRGALSEAAALVDQALALAPGSRDAAAVAERIRQARERLAALDDAIGQGRRCLDDGSYERARAAANLALAIDGDNEDAVALLRAAEGAIDARKRAEEARARAEAERREEMRRAEQVRLEAEAKRREQEAARQREAELEAARQREAEAARLREQEAARQRDAQAARQREQQAAQQREKDAARLRQAASPAAPAPPIAPAAPPPARAPRPDAATIIVGAAPRKPLETGRSAPQTRQMLVIAGGIAAALIVIIAVIVSKLPGSGGEVAVTTTASPTTVAAATTSAVEPTPATISPAPAPPTSVPTMVINQPAAALDTATLVIDALPWAQIVEVRNESNAIIPLPSSFTPLAITVPAGRYQVTLKRTDLGTRTERVTVEPAKGGRVFVEFKKIDADAYFKRIGS
jgi:protein kinase-like protein